MSDEYEGTQIAADGRRYPIEDFPIDIQAPTMIAETPEGTLINPAPSVPSHEFIVSLVEGEADLLNPP